MNAVTPEYRRADVHDPARVLGSFAVLGLLFSVWQVVLPDLQQALRRRRR